MPALRHVEVYLILFRTHFIASHPIFTCFTDHWCFMSRLYYHLRPRTPKSTFEMWARMVQAKNRCFISKLRREICVCVENWASKIHITPRNPSVCLGTKDFLLLYTATNIYGYNLDDLSTLAMIPVNDRSDVTSVDFDAGNVYFC